jgi:hypothetical protein
MQDRAGDTEHPRVFAGCHRRQQKSKLGPKNLSPRFVCGEKHGWPIVPASPDRVVGGRESCGAARCLFRKEGIRMRDFSVR